AAVAAPLDHRKVFPVPVAAAVNVVELPAQKAVFPVICTFGSAFAVIVTEAGVPVQLPEVLVRVYVPAVVTVIDWVVAPVDQVFPVAKLEVSVTLPVPHITVEEAVIVGTTVWLTVS